MATGGRRPGAGRKPGSVNVMSRLAREEAAATGELPHFLLLRISRGERIGDYEPTFADRVDAAKAAAPYFAPKLAATEVTTREEDRPARELTDAELAAIIARGKPANSGN